MSETKEFTLLSKEEGRAICHATKLTKVQINIPFNRSENFIHVIISSKDYVDDMGETGSYLLATHYPEETLSIIKSRTRLLWLQNLPVKKRQGKFKKTKKPIRKSAPSSPFYNFAEETTKLKKIVDIPKKVLRKLEVEFKKLEIKNRNQQIKIDLLGISLKELKLKVKEDKSANTKRMKNYRDLLVVESENYKEDPNIKSASIREMKIKNRISLQGDLKRILKYKLRLKEPIDDAALEGVIEDLVIILK